MFEYAVLAQIAVLVSSLSGLEARIAENLTLKERAAKTVVVAQAKARRVPVGGARTAYARAPFRLPALRAVYASGWITGASTPGACISVHLAPGDVRSRTAKQLARTGRLKRSLGALRLDAKAAAMAYTKGLASACS